MYQIVPDTLFYILPIDYCRFVKLSILCTAFNQLFVKKYYIYFFGVVLNTFLLIKCMCGLIIKITKKYRKIN